MNLRRLQTIMIEQGIAPGVAENVINALSEPDDIQATKKDIRDIENNIKLEIKEVNKAISDLETHMLTQINLQTWRFFGGLAGFSFLVSFAGAVINIWIKRNA